MTRFADLPPADQRQIAAGRAVAPAVKSRRPARADPASPRAGRIRWRCSRCDVDPFPTYRAAEQHLDATHGAGRLEAVITR